MSFFSMSKIVLKSLFQKPVTRLYPFVARNYYAGSRGHIRIEIKDCIFCGICERKCPTSAIKVVRNDKTWEIDRLGCVSCNFCVEVCPKKCLFMENTYSPAQAVKTKDTHHA